MTATSRTHQMANLKGLKKLKLEKYLGMGSGYVCDFSNRTFADFVLENTGVDIADEKYALASGSKANRLRAFWGKESNYLVAKLLREMIEYWRVQRSTPLYGSQPLDPVLYEECKQIVTKMQSENPIENVGVLNPNSGDKDFKLLATSIRESIDRGQPEQSLDRLHTFVVKYMRILCDKRSIPYNKETPLHSLFGGYVKFLQEKNILESEMSARILKSSTSVLEAFNSVRNTQSFAHANPVLNYNESVLIFNNISNTLRFIELIEGKIAEEEKKKKEDEIAWKDPPFSEEEIEAAGNAWIQSEIDRMRGK